MSPEQHRTLIDMASCAESQVDTDIIKYMMKMQYEIDDLKNIIVELLSKEYPEDVLKYADYLRTD